MRRHWRSAAARLALVCVLVAVASQAPAQEEGGPTVSEHGVGTAVEDRNLEGRKETFVEGERAFFWTLVAGEIKYPIAGMLITAPMIAPKETKTTFTKPLRLR